MLLRDLPKHISVDVEESLSDRFMDSEELYVRFLKKLRREAFGELKEAADAGDWQSVAKKAHNLKGVTANLGLKHLQELSAALVKLLREESFGEQEAMALADELESEGYKSIAHIEMLDG